MEQIDIQIRTEPLRTVTRNAIDGAVMIVLAGAFLYEVFVKNDAPAAISSLGILLLIAGIWHREEELDKMHDYLYFLAETGGTVSLGDDDAE